MWVDELHEPGRLDTIKSSLSLTNIISIKWFDKEVCHMDAT